MAVDIRFWRSRVPEAMRNLAALGRWLAGLNVPCTCMAASWEPHRDDCATNMQRASNDIIEVVAALLSENQGQRLLLKRARDEYIKLKMIEAECRKLPYVAAVDPLVRDINSRIGEEVRQEPVPWI